EQQNRQFFDTLSVVIPSGVEGVRAAALAKRINFRYVDDRTIGIALNETTTLGDVNDILEVLTAGAGREDVSIGVAVDDEEESQDEFPAWLRRASRYLTHPVFNSHHSETQMMRYIRALERKDIGLDHSMIPLGSCTMKLNAATEMRPVTWPAWGRLHPFAPRDQAAG